MADQVQKLPVDYHVPTIGEPENSRSLGSFKSHMHLIGGLSFLISMIVAYLSIAPAFSGPNWGSDMHSQESQSFTNKKDDFFADKIFTTRQSSSHSVTLERKH